MTPPSAEEPGSALRVALVCPYDLTVPGGVQAHVRHLAAELRERGDEVLVVAPAGGDAPEDVVAAGSSIRVPFNASVAPISLAPFATRRALDALRRFQPDVTHVHEPAVPLVSLAVTLRGPQPIVGTFHAWSDRDAAYRLARPLARAAAGRLAARVAVSRPAVDYHSRALGVPAGTFRVIPNGVDVARFRSGRPIPELVKDGAPTLLFVGRLEARKGLEQLVRAFVRLKRQRPTLRLLVVGDGPERARCQQLLTARLRADVLFLGQVDEEDKPRFHASADLFVAPNLGGESFGMVLLEAMAAGLPVVASDIPGFRSVIRDGVEGRLVPPGNVAALAEAVDTLLANAALREALGEQATATVERYDWSVVADELRGLYRRVLAAS